MIYIQDGVNEDISMVSDMNFLGNQLILSLDKPIKGEQDSEKLLS